MINKNIVFLSYGADNEYKRALFCILSYSAWCTQYQEDTRIIIYTDCIPFFEPHLNGLQVQYFLLTKTLLDEMLGGTGFFHRRKVAVIDLTFKMYPGEDVLFIDSDTFFIADPISLMKPFVADESFMHMREYTLEQGLRLFTSYNQKEYPEAFINYISHNEFLIRGSYEKFDQYDYSWNSGVLGLHADFGKYMVDVFKLTDNFYKHSKWFISEQLAFSLILQRKTSIKPTDNYILHYWDVDAKKLQDGLLNDLFTRQQPLRLHDKAFIKKLTHKWRRQLKAHDLQKQIRAAFANDSYYYGLKKIVQFMLNGF